MYPKVSKKDVINVLFSYCGYNAPKTPEPVFQDLDDGEFDMFTKIPGLNVWDHFQNEDKYQPKIMEEPVFKMLVPFDIDFSFN